jgi:hypothetical protein
MHSQPDLRRPYRRGFQIFALFIAGIIGMSTPLSFAQQRMSDKDIEATMRNLKEDAKKFQKNFDDALKKSSIRKTSQEKDAKTLVQRFENQANGMLNQFQKTKKAEDALRAILGTADGLQRTAENAGITAQVSATWSPVRTTLDQLASQFNVTTTQ